MRNSISLLSLFFLLLLGRVQAPAQSVIQRDFNEYQRQALTEKIFAHTDRETYLSGETIWFSLYVVDGLIHHRLDLSKTGYVEILDQYKRPLIQTKIQLEDGRGSGSFDVPDAVSGRYTFRAYTRWMRNFGPDYFFEKELVIINASQPNADRSLEVGNQIEVRDDISVRFFPEGGHLVQNLRSRVAFQALDKYGKGIDIEGYIRNDAGDTVSQFSTLKFGIGSFSFTPLPEVRYEAVVSYQGKQSNHAIPEVNAKGYVLNVNTLNNAKIHVVISRAGIETADTMTLFVHTRNKIKVVQATTLKDGVGGFLIDRNKLDEGISHLTLFNGKGQPVCERLYFIRPTEELKPEIKLEKNLFANREKVTMRISAKTAINSSVTASLSVSVYKLDSTQFNSPMNIHQYLMLSSDLKGDVESCEYYFESNDSVVSEATDNLMLTHGWRRFIWNDILERKTVSRPFSPDYEGMVISGTLLHPDSSPVTATEKAYLSFPGTHPQFFTAQTDVNGHFEFLVKNPLGRREALIQVVGSQELYSVSLHPPFSTEYSSRKTHSLQLPDNMKNAVLLNAIHSQARNYFFKEPSPEVMPTDDSVLFFGTPDKTYRLNDYQRFPTVEDVVREYVPEVTVITKGKRKGLYVLNRKKEEFFEEDPLVLVDGIPITSTHRVTVMPAADVKTMDIIAQRYRLGPISFGGIVSLKTSNGRLGGLEPEPGAYAFDFEGLQIKREFYSPFYSSSRQSDRIPDFRNVLYWQPILTSSGKGDEVSFFTSDETGLFIVVVQGLTEDGIAGASTFMFRVGDPE